MHFLLYRNLNCTFSTTKSAGIAGGAFVNLLLIEGFKYETKQSTTMTYIFLMGGSLASTLVSTRAAPIGGKRQVDYRLVLLTLPMMITGSLFGVMIC